MIQRFIRLLGWVCYAVAAISVCLLLWNPAVGDVIFFRAVAILFLLIGRGIIYVAVGPRLNPF